MAYRVEYTPGAKHELAGLPREVQERIRPKVDALADNPHPSGVKKLKGRENRWRIRVGDYRVVYEIHDKVLVVLVVKIGHRRDVYE